MGNNKISRLLFADDLVLLASSESGLQRALNGFAAACDIAGMKISTSKTEVLHLSRKPDQCSLQVSGVSLKQVEKFKYLGVAFTSDGRQDEELGHPNWQSNCSSASLAPFRCHEARNLKKAKLSVSKTVFIIILTYGHKSWVMTERVRSLVQAASFSLEFERAPLPGILDRSRSQGLSFYHSGPPECLG